MSLSDDLEAEVGPVKPKPGPKKSTGNNGHSGESSFDIVNRIDTGTVLDALNVEHDDKRVKCPGCGEGMDGTDVALVDGGYKCSHDRCANKGKNGFRTNVDLVCEVLNKTPQEAVSWLAEKFNIDLPQTQTSTNDSEGAKQPLWGGGPKEDRKPLRARTIRDIVTDWSNEGKVVRIPTGIKSLDEACGGGLPLPRIVLIIGAPSAGKTFTEIVLADTFASNYAAMGFCVGIMAIDEADLDIGGRIAQRHGFSRDEIDSRDPKILGDIERMLGPSKIRFYGPDWTIEGTVDDLTTWAKPDNSPMVLCVDSLHTVRSVGSDVARNRKEFVDANCDALKRANIDHRITIIATGEMARSQYANEQFAHDSVAIAACADSRGPEFMAEVLMKLTSPKGIDDVVCVEMPKNRGGKRNVKFWLQFNFNQHTLTECGDPNEDPVVVEQRETEKHDKLEKKQTAFAEKLGAFIMQHQHQTKRQLIALAKVEFHCGQGSIENGLTVLVAGKTRYRLIETKEGEGKTAPTYLDVELTAHSDATNEGNQND